MDFISLTAALSVLNTPVAFAADPVRDESKDVGKDIDWALDHLKVEQAQTTPLTLVENPSLNQNNK